MNYDDELDFLLAIGAMTEEAEEKRKHSEYIPVAGKRKLGFFESILEFFLMIFIDYAWGRALFLLLLFGTFFLCAMLYLG